MLTTELDPFTYQFASSMVTRIGRDGSLDDGSFDVASLRQPEALVTLPNSQVLVVDRLLVSVGSMGRVRRSPASGT